jgi:hypothetical protein
LRENRLTEKWGQQISETPLVLFFCPHLLPVAPSRFDMKTETLHLKLPSHLQKLMQYFEINCVAACCGLDAYEFNRQHASNATAENGEAWIDAALLELQHMALEIESLPDDWKVVCFEMNAAWSKEEAKTFWDMLGNEIGTGIEICRAAKEDADSQHDPNQTPQH